MKRSALWIRRLAVYMVGLFMMAVGVTFSRSSDLGVSPVNAIPNVLSVMLDVDMGICTTGVFILFIGVQFLILRKDFKLKYLLQILCSTLFGVFVSAANRTVGVILPPCGSYFMRLVYIAVSMVLTAAGIMLYLGADILSLPAEGVMQAISEKTGKPLPTIKSLFDCSVILIAAIISFAAFGRLNGVREGSVIAAVGVGFILKLFRGLCGKSLDRFLGADRP